MVIFYEFRIKSVVFCTLHNPMMHFENKFFLKILTSN